MSMQPGPDQQQAPAGPPPPAPSIAEVQQALLRAVNVAASASAGSQDVREVKEFGGAALAFAQAYVTLDPGLVAPQGVPAHVLAAAVPTPSPAADAGTGGTQP